MYPTIRNNNPLNIKWSALNNWKGQTGKDERGFVQFTTPQQGARAASKILRSYKRRGIVTLRDIIYRWAPPEDNNPTEAYIEFVSDRTGLSPNDNVSQDSYPQMLAAMAKMETGDEIPVELFIEGEGLV